MTEEGTCEEQAVPAISKERSTVAAASAATGNSRAAAFALLGMMNWIYQCYRPEGALDEGTRAAIYGDSRAGAFQ